MIILLSLPAWAPVVRWQRAPSMRALLSVIVFTIGTCVQLSFVILVLKQVLTLDYSIRFGAYGVFCCVIAMALAVGDSPTAFGVIISSLLAAAMWLFLALLH